jgi:hypothetical protein
MSVGMKGWRGKSQLAKDRRRTLEKFLWFGLRSVTRSCVLLTPFGKKNILRRSRNGVDN